MKRIIALTILLLLIFPWSTVANDLSPEQQRETAIQRAMSGTVKIQPQPFSYGSGFFVAENYVITNFHVVSATVEGIKITKSDGTECKGNRVYNEEGRDLALIKVDCRGEPLELSTHVGVGQDIYITGNPSSLDFTATSGMVAKVLDRATWRFIVADIFAEHGSSGSAMIDSSGKVVGVVKGMQKDANYLVYAIPFDEVRQFISRAGVI